MNVVDTLAHVLLVSGPAWVLWLLLALSVLVFVVAVERWFVFRRRSGNAEHLAIAVEAHMRSEQRDEKIRWPECHHSLAARVAEAGLAYAVEGESAASKAMQSRTALEREQLEKRLIVMGTIGNNAPFIGLLGTVIGVVQAFAQLGTTGAAPQEQSAAVMAGISEALVATAVGLLVAIPAVILFNYFHRRLAAMLSASEVVSGVLLANVGQYESPPPEEGDTVVVEDAELEGSSGETGAAERAEGDSLARVGKGSKALSLAEVA